MFHKAPKLNLSLTEFLSGKGLFHNQYDVLHGPPQLLTCYENIRIKLKKKTLKNYFEFLYRTYCLEEDKAYRKKRFWISTGKPEI